MLERPPAGERAVIVQLDFGNDDLSEQLEEVRLLTESAGAYVCSEIYGRRQSPDPATYAGKGKVQEVAAEVAAHGPMWLFLITNYHPPKSAILSECSSVVWLIERA